jgi:hypothetical protein
LELCGKKGFADYRNVNVLTEIGMIRGVATGNFDRDACSAISQVQCPPLLTICSDQEGTQISGSCFMASHMRLSMAYFRDFFHRLHNDCMTAISTAGLMPNFFAGIAILNLGYGPYETAHWWHSMLAEAADIAKKCDENNPLLIRLWDWICASKSDRYTETSDASVGAPARKAFLWSLADKELLHFRNVQVKPSKWMSFPQAYSSWKDHLPARAFVLASYVLEKNYVKDVDDLFTSHQKSRFGVQPGETGPKLFKTPEMRTAKQKIDDLRRRARHTLIFVVKLMLDPEVTEAMNTICIGVQALYDWFIKMEINLKGSLKCAAYSQEWSSWSWLEPLTKTWQVAKNLEGLGRSGLTVVFRNAAMKRLRPDSPEVALEDAKARVMHRYLASLVEEVAGSMLWWTSHYPGKLAGLLLPSSVDATLAELKYDCEAFWAAKVIRRTARQLISASSQVFV